MTEQQRENPRDPQRHDSAPPAPDPSSGAAEPTASETRAGADKEAAGRPVSGGSVLLLYLAAFVGLVLLLDAIAGGSEARPLIRYDAFLSFVEQGKVESAVVSNDEISGTFKQPTELKGKDGKPLADKAKRFRTLRVHRHDALVSILREHGVRLEGRRDSTEMQQILLWGLLIVLMLVGWYFILKRLNPNKEAMAFGRTRARVVAEDDIDVTFDDVAGIDEAREELQELILFLRDPERFERIGARIPCGVLLVGSPGTGKTMLAKALAGESGVPFFSLSGSDFVEMFAGVGASRVRDLFDQAEKARPCIVFIDELDAIGKIRGVGGTGPSDEREQTLNMLLAEMDGFDTTRGIILLGATNRPEILDPALLRPGRFDRQIVIDRPDLQGRREILAVHLRKVRLAPDVEVEQLARMTPGFVGADLANLVNESALLAARRDRDAVTFADFEEALERIVAGLERRRNLMRPHEKRRIAFHETGHALMGLCHEHTDPVHRVSIVSRGQGALGYTLQMPADERYLLTESELLERIDVMLGGRCAEKVIFGDLSTGAADDLRRAVALARRMVLEFGMSTAFGAVAFGTGPRRSFLGDEGPSVEREISDQTAREIDNEVRRIVGAAEARVMELLEDRREALEAIAAVLIEQETLDHDELIELAVANDARPHPSKLGKAGAGQASDRPAETDSEAETSSEAETGSETETDGAGGSVVDA